MAKTDLAILIKTLYDGKGAKAATKDMTGLEKQSGKAGATLKGMGAILGTVGIGLAAAGVAAMAAKKAFDFSREGAALNQLEESFDLMNAEVFKTPDLLNQMKDASRSTVKEADIMKGILTLTAGATREVASAMAQASPQLMKIAKAANKMNPTLGDTAFLYDSLALGIKRSSPMILDNLGLTIKVGQANEDYAKSIGKTVKELTAQEKQLALLEAALKAGDTLIQQVGGNVDSTTDSYDKLTTAYGEAIDMAKKEMAANDKAVAFAAESLDLRNRSIKAFNILQKAYERGAISARKLDTAYRLMNADEALFLELNEDLIESLIKSSEVTGTLREQNLRFRLEQNRLRQGTDELTESTEDLTESLKESGLAAYAATEAESERLALQREAADHINNILIEAEEEHAEALNKAKEATREYNAHMGDLFNAAIEAEGEIDDLNQRLYDQAKAAGANNIALAALGIELGLFTEAEAEAAIKSAALWAAVDLLGQKVGEGTLTISGAVDAFGLLQSGMADSANKAIALTTEMDIAKQALENIAGNWEIMVNANTSAAEAKIRRLNDMLDRLGTPGNVPGEEPGAGPVTPPHPDHVPGARGLDFTVPPGFPNDSFPIRVQSGEHVQVTPAGRRRGGISAPVINVYMTLMGGGNPAFIGQEVAKSVANTLGNSMRG